MTESAGSGQLHEAKQAFEASERRFRLLADNAPVLIWRACQDKRCDWFNKPWLDFTGRTMEQEFGFGWAEGVHREDYDRCLDVYTTAFDARQPFTMDYRLRRHDGAHRWIRDNGVPFFDDDGRFAGYFGSGIDITDHVENEQRLRSALVEAERQERQQRLLHVQQERLIQELNHRVKNTLVTVQSIAAQSLRGVDPGGAAQAMFDGRLMALSQAHDVLARERWRGAQLGEIVERATSSAAARTRIQIEGPAVLVAPKLALGLAMANHELCMNAVRYGALSADAGSVTIRWTLQADADPPQLEFRWTEQDGPPVTPPEHHGFGMRFVGTGFPREFGGSVEFTFGGAGLSCVIRTPNGQDELATIDGLVALHR